MLVDFPEYSEHFYSVVLDLSGFGISRYTVDLCCAVLANSGNLVGYLSIWVGFEKFRLFNNLGLVCASFGKFKYLASETRKKLLALTLWLPYEMRLNLL